MRVLVLGFGVVGKGLFKLLPQRFEVAGVFSSKGGVTEASLAELRKAAEENACLSSVQGFAEGLDSAKAVRELDYDVFVELTPTNMTDGQPALDCIKNALERGKHVVTSNKGPIALAYPELNSLAEENHCLLRFEATVGGAIPLFNTVRALPERVRRVRGIVNGTTNYILCKMEDGLGMQEALRQAQEMGVAEADPTYDVEGIDAAAKACILANVVVGKRVSFSEVKRKGIAGVTLEDVENAKKEGKRIKLIAEASEEKASVEPVALPLEDMLAHVSGTMNAVTLDLPNGGPLTMIRYGAGQLPTASAVLMDLLEVERHGGSR